MLTMDVTYGKKKKVKEADLYSAFIEVPYTQGAQVRITHCYLQTTPYLPSTALISFHWLRVPERILFKLAVLTYMV